MSNKSYGNDSPSLSIYALYFAIFIWLIALDKWLEMGGVFVTSFGDQILELLDVKKE